MEPLTLLALGLLALGAFMCRPVSEPIVLPIPVETDDY